MVDFFSNSQQDAADSLLTILTEHPSLLRSRLVAEQFARPVVDPLDPRNASDGYTDKLYRLLDAIAGMNTFLPHDFWPLFLSHVIHQAVVRYRDNHGAYARLLHVLATRRLPWSRSTAGTRPTSAAASTSRTITRRRRRGGALRREGADRSA
jgi:hypothetical protein